MKTVNLTELLYISEYVITAAILFLSAVKKRCNGYKKRNPADRLFTAPHSYGNHSCSRHFLMALLYMTPLQDVWKIRAVGTVRSLMTILAYTVFSASLFQRYRVYPRGQALAAVLLLLYAVADLFMTGTTMKYVILAAAAAGGFLLPDRWKS
ncbi:MAG: hypothetical protein ACLR1D_00795 [Dialister sp.]